MTSIHYYIGQSAHSAHSQEMHTVTIAKTFSARGYTNQEGSSNGKNNKRPQYVHVSDESLTTNGQKKKT